MKKERQNSGITLIALVITIIVLLILAGVTIVTLTGNNGLLQKAGNAKEKNNIGLEKEQISLVATEMKLEQETDTKKREQLFQDHLDKYAGEGKTKVYASNESYTTHFLETNRIYTLDEFGNIIEEDISMIKHDNTPGAFDGSGSKTNPWIIMSIEDLVYFSKEVSNGNSYSGKYIELGKPLDFNSKLSYNNVNVTYSYDENTTNYIQDENSETTLMKLCSENLGFIPIGTGTSFSGSFNGKGYKIKNVYVNRSGNAGLFGYESRGKIADLKVEGKIVSTDGNSGGIVGAAWNTDDDSIKNCEFKGTVEGNTAGGIVGKVDRNGWGAINNCDNYGNINGTTYAGGIVGDINGNRYYINSCINLGIINSKTSGGIVRKSYSWRV